MDSRDTMHALYKHTKVNRIFYSPKYYCFSSLQLHDIFRSNHHPGKHLHVQSQQERSWEKALDMFKVNMKHTGVDMVSFLL